MITLSIAIPTYNRRERLINLLRSVPKSIGGLKNKIEVVVSDNSDEALNVSILEDCLDGVRFVYEKNIKNIGMELNIVKAASLASGNYVLLIGDDDSLSCNALENLVERIDQEQPDLFFLNYAFVNSYGKEFGRAMMSGSCNSAQVLIEKYLWALGFIGSFVIRREYWDKFDKSTMIGNYFPHCDLIFDVLRSNSKVTYFDYPVVLNNCGSVDDFTWRKNFIRTLYGFELIVHKYTLRTDLPFLQGLKVLKEHAPHRKLFVLLELKSNSMLNDGDLELISDSFGMKCKYFLVNVLPVGLCRFGVSVYKCVRQLKQNMRCLIEKK